MSTKFGDGLTRAIRCGYISCNDPKIDKQVKGDIPSRVWRIYDRTLCFFSKKRKEEMLNTLKFFENTVE